MVKKEIEIKSFYYFGKLPQHSEFIGQYPPKHLKNILDGWSILLNKERTERWEEKALFAIPDESMQEFLVGIVWNSEDVTKRKYPFAIFVKIARASFFPSPLIFCDASKLVKSIENVWKIWGDQDLKQLQIDICDVGKVLVQEDSTLKTIKPGQPPIIKIKSVLDWENMYTSSHSLAKEWSHQMNGILMRKIVSGMSLKCMQTTPPHFLAFAQNTSFARFISQKYGQLKK
jgi:type VI secretion system ImpM family protein